ncbi:MAG: hypothetical protein COA78_14440 [Blastopirellula sp.]|nr:MAG: hypothetical protein COA78_14440 [Blastopirellula sp.]
MSFYYAYDRTPELQSLPTQSQRNAVHSTAWNKYTETHGNPGLRGLMIVIPCMLAVCAFNHFLGDMSPLSILLPQEWIVPATGGIGGGLGAILHFHFLATALRPYYRDAMQAGEFSLGE